MHYTPVLTSLGYTPNDALKAQVKRCIEEAGLSVPDLDKIAELNEEIKTMDILSRWERRWKFINHRTPRSWHSLSAVPRS